MLCTVFSDTPLKNANQFRVRVQNREVKEGKCTTSLAKNPNGSRITDVTTDKDLGSHISWTLSWNDHIDLFINRINKMLGLIYRTCTSKCDQITLLTIYKSLVRPQLARARFTSLSPYTKGKVMATGRVQGRATKFLLKCDFSITSWTLSQIRSFYLSSLEGTF